MQGKVIQFVETMSRVDDFTLQGIDEEVGILSSRYLPEDTIFKFEVRQAQREVGWVA